MPKTCHIDHRAGGHLVACCLAPKWGRGRVARCPLRCVRCGILTTSSWGTVAPIYNREQQCTKIVIGIIKRRVVPPSPPPSRRSVGKYVEPIYNKAPQLKISFFGIIKTLPPKMRRERSTFVLSLPMLTKERQDQRRLSRAQSVHLLLTDGLACCR